MLIHVKVSAGEKREKFEEISDTRFVISVKEKAERNMANRRVMAILAGHFKVPERSVRVISGHHSPSKIIEIIGK